MYISKIVFSITNRSENHKLVLKHPQIGYIQMCLNHDPIRGGGGWGVVVPQWGVEFFHWNRSKSI